MKKVLMIFVIASLSVVSFSYTSPAKYKKLWHKVEKLEMKGKLKRSEKRVNKIYKKALEGKDNAQIVRALLYKTRYISYREKYKYAHTIPFLEKQVKFQQFPVKNILHSYLAELYQMLSRRIFRNPPMTFKPENSKLPDLYFLSQEELDKKIRSHFEASLSHADRLRQIRLDGYIELISTKANTDLLPMRDLYDLLVIRTLNYMDDPYVDEEGIDLHKLTDEMLLPVDNFLESKLTLIQSLPELKTSTDYFRTLLRESLRSNDRGMFFFIDAMRITAYFDIAKDFEGEWEDSWDNNYSYAERKELDALKFLLSKPNIGDQYPAVAFLLASRYKQCGNEYDPSYNQEYRLYKKKAFELCKDAVKKFPLSRYTPLSNALTDLIQLPSLSVILDRYLPPQSPSKAIVNFQNITKLYVKIAQTKKFLEESDYSHYFDFEEAGRALANSLSPIKEWKIKLPNPDFQEHNTEIVIPGLPIGRYYLFMSNTPEFDEKKGGVLLKEMEVTPVGVMFEKTDEQHLRCRIVDRVSGKGIPNVRVICSNHISHTGSVKKSTDLTIEERSNGDGQVIFPYTGNRAKIKVVYKGMEYEFYKRSFIPEKQKRSVYTDILLDRAIYRPGQAVYFKGITYETDTKGKRALANRKVTYDCLSSDGKEIGKLLLKTNDFGSATGSFKIPKNTMTGKAYISSSLNGKSRFSIEEYKRPKYEIAFDEPPHPLKNNETVTVSGTVRTLSGEAVSRAEISYSIDLEVYFKFAEFWEDWGDSVGTVKEGETATDSKGKFEVSFQLKKPDSIPNDNLRGYVVNVKATTEDGETVEDDEEVRVADISRIISMDFSENVNTSRHRPFSVSIHDLYGNPESQAISVSIHKLKKPDRVVMKRQLIVKPDIQLIDEKTHDKLFEGEPYGEEYKPSTWKIEKTVYQKQLMCNGKLRLPLLNTSDWKPGEYRVDIELDDPTGKKQKKSKYLTVFNPETTACPVSSVLWADFPSYTTKGAALTVYVASAAQNTDVLLQVVGSDRILNEQHIRLSNELRKISIPLSESTESPISVRASTVKFNRYFEKDKEIYLKPPAKKLSLKILNKKKVLEPGETGTSTIQLKTGKAPEPDGELTVTLYDASLDFFDSNEFCFTPKTDSPSFPESFVQHSLRREYWDFDLRSYWDYEIDSGGENEGELDRSPFYSLKDPLNWYGVYHNYYLDLKTAKGNKTTGRTILTYIPSKVNSPGIEGVVTEKSGTRLPGVTVLLRGISNQTVYQIATSENGEFGFSKLPAGTYECTFSMPGFKALTRKNLVVTTGVVIKVNAVLVAAEVQESIVVTAEAPLVANPDDDTETGTLPEPEEKSKPSCNIVFRKNFKETALFVPILKPDRNGTAKIQYKMPDSITRWNLKAFAHTRDLRTACGETSLVTKKEIMVIPNFPRFFRSGDTIVVKANTFNTSGKPFKGQIDLKLVSPDTGEIISSDFGPDLAGRPCTTEAYGHSVFQWKLQIPRGLESIQYRVLVDGNLGNDGQQGVIPVLPAKLRIQDSVPFVMSYNRKKTISVEKVLNASQNRTIALKKMTVEIDNNPTWIVVNSLPYLMEFPHECNEQLFSRYFANTVAENLLKTSPELVKLISAYGNSSGKYSTSSTMPQYWKENLEKNRKNLKTLASLFQNNRLMKKNKKVLEQLEERQSSKGGWPWFPGMNQSVYITQYIISGFGMMQKMGVISQQDPAIKRMVRKAVRFADEKAVSTFKDSWKDNETPHLTESMIQYLYARSFYKNIKPDPGTSAMIDTYLSLGESEWINQFPMMKGMLAISLYRFGKKAAARGILRFLKNTAVLDNEKGMYWTAFNRGFYWYGSEIDNACIMLEAFQEIEKDQRATELLKLFILRHKKTSAWSNTRSTTLACYALLKSGRNKSETPPDVKVKMGSNVFHVRGTSGPLQLNSISFTDKEIVPDLGKITIEKSSDRPILGAVHLETLEDLNEIKASEGGLSVTKTLMLVPANAPRFKAVPLTRSTKLHPGDKIMVNLYLNAESDFTYVHLKDMRPSGFEPISVHSTHKWENGLSYFESIRDDSVNMFFSRIPKGEHLITYELRTVNPGDFNTGIAEIQCMYAPEYKGHSDTGMVRVSDTQSDAKATPHSSPVTAAKTP